MPEKAHGSNSCIVYAMIIALAVFGLLFYAYTIASAKAKQAICMSYSKQLGLSFLLYSQDYDTRFPPADRWVSALVKHGRKSEFFDCPAAKGNGPDYSMNAQLSSLMLKRVENPMGTVLMFDSVPTGRHYGGGELLPVPGRHRDGNNFVFSDGHIRFFKDTDVPTLNWKP